MRTETPKQTPEPDLPTLQIGQIFADIERQHHPLIGNRFKEKTILKRSEQVVKALRPVVEAVRAWEQIYAKEDETGLKNKYQELKKKYLKTIKEKGQGLQGKALEKLENQTLDELLPQVFALVSLASQKTIGLRHYDIQIIGGVLLYKNKALKMRTGEGKTLVTTLPAALRAITGKGCHVITANEYLAKRDPAWMGPIYETLGISVGALQDRQKEDQAFIYNPKPEQSKKTDPHFPSLQPATQQQACNCDITYGMSHDFAFAYLFDHMATEPNSTTLKRPLNSAIIDEVDNTLLDEAKTPHKISSDIELQADLFNFFARLVPTLKPSSKDSVDKKNPDGDYIAEEKTKTFLITDKGYDKIINSINDGKLPGLLYGGQLSPYLHQIMTAYLFYKKDVDYKISDDGQIIIIDPQTGRLQPGRKWGDGLQQAIEALEGLQITSLSRTTSSITVQSFFKLYPHLAGESGSLIAGAEEFSKTYGLEVIILPSHVEYQALLGNLKKTTTTTTIPLPFDPTNKNRDSATQEIEQTLYLNPEDGQVAAYQRLDYPLVAYASMEGKWNAIVAEIKYMMAQNRPVLVGTDSVKASQHLSDILASFGIDHEVLNAVNPEQEAEIIAQAGRKGKITISTNMAGRGVDIMLGGNFEEIAKNQLSQDHPDLDLAQIQPQWQTTVKSLKNTGRISDHVSQQPWAQALQSARDNCQRNRQEVIKAGGLHVIACQLGPSKRLGTQLIGRAGRQGDPGSSRIFCSLQDPLFTRFDPNQTTARMLKKLRINSKAPLSGPFIYRPLRNIQEKAEGYDFEARQSLARFEKPVEKARRAFFQERQEILTTKNFAPIMATIGRGLLEKPLAIIANLAQKEFPDQQDWQQLFTDLKSFYQANLPLSLSNKLEETRQKIFVKNTDAKTETFNLPDNPGLVLETICRELAFHLNTNNTNNAKFIKADKLLELAKIPDQQQRLAKLGKYLEGQASHLIEPYNQAYVTVEVLQGNQKTNMKFPLLSIVKTTFLNKADERWSLFLSQVDDIREGIGLQAYGQQQPIIAFIENIFNLHRQNMNGLRILLWQFTLYYYTQAKNQNLNQA